MVTTIRFGLAVALFCSGCSSSQREKLGAVHSALASRSGVVRVTTDAHEKIVDVTIIKSSGSSALDRHIVADTKDHWHGAVSSIQNVVVKYKPGPNGQPEPTFQLKLR